MTHQAEPSATEEAAWFREKLADVTPLAPSNRITAKTPARLIPRDSSPTHADVLDQLSDHGAQPEPLVEFARNGLNKMTLRKLRRGVWRPQDDLDLHGLSRDQARILLQDFLQQAVQNHIRCVNVIHGKGWRSDGREGLLKSLTRHWLTQHAHVLAFCDAPLNAGGGGAVWVLLAAP